MNVVWLCTYMNAMCDVRLLYRGRRRWVHCVADGRKTEWPRVYSPISSGQQREIAESAYNLTAID